LAARFGAVSTIDGGVTINNIAAAPMTAAAKA
jgi:hypothetical protein